MQHWTHLPSCCVIQNACIMLFLQAGIRHSCNHCRQLRDPAGVPQPGRAVHAVLVPAQCSRGDSVRMGCSPVPWCEVSPPLLAPERWRAGGTGLRSRRRSGAITWTHRCCCCLALFNLIASARDHIVCSCAGSASPYLPSSETHPACEAAVQQSAAAAGVTARLLDAAATVNV